MSAARTQSISGKWGCKLCHDEILTKAIDEHRIVLTFDLDFGEIAAFSHGRIVSVILFRLHNTRTPHVIQRLESALKFPQELEHGAVIVVEEMRCRVRRLPIGRRDIP